MAADTRQYDVRGTKASWRKWKRRLKRSTARAARRDSKVNLDNAKPRVTGGWVD